MAQKNGCAQEFDGFARRLRDQSGVIVTLPAGIARDLATDPRTIYAGYESLVGARARRPAKLLHDRHRAAVGGMLFGTYANMIRYGVLSLTTAGLPTYGDVYCRLRAVAVQDRVSFLERNSYAFVALHKLKPGDSIPLGFRSVWADRHLLALAKLAVRLRPRTTPSDWQRLLIESDGISRENDEFIEAHIYDSFDIAAIEAMVPVPRRRKRSDPAELDVRVALEKFGSLKRKRAP